MTASNNRSSRPLSEPIPYLQGSSLSISQPQGKDPGNEVVPADTRLVLHDRDATDRGYSHVNALCCFVLSSFSHTGKIFDKTRIIFGTSTEETIHTSSQDHTAGEEGTASASSHHCVLYSETLSCYLTTGCDTLSVCGSKRI